jgi:hypothetical protein
MGKHVTPDTAEEIVEKLVREFREALAGLDAAEDNLRKAIKMPPREFVGVSVTYGSRSEDERP